MNLHKISIVLAFTIASATHTAWGQNTQTPFDPSQSATAIHLSIGGGAAASQWFQDLYDYGNSSGSEADLGGLAVGLSVTRAISSRVQLGGEVGVFVIGPGSLRGISYGPYYQCYGSGCAGSPTDDTGIHFGPLASLRLFSIGRFIFRVEGGGGLNFFNLNDAGPAQSKNRSIEFIEGSPYYSAKPGSELYFVWRVSPGFALAGHGGSGFTLNPYFSFLKTTGETATKSITFGGSIGLLIGGK